MNLHHTFEDRALVRRLDSLRCSTDERDAITAALARTAMLAGVSLAAMLASIRRDIDRRRAFLRRTPAETMMVPPFGRHRHRTLLDIAVSDPAYIRRLARDGDEFWGFAARVTLRFALAGGLP